MMAPVKNGLKAKNGAESNSKQQKEKVNAWTAT
jgi:hypothetical protein